MKLIKYSKLTGLPLLAGACALTLSACGSDGGGTANATQVDRMARAGVNTAVTDPFFLSGDADDNAEHGQITDNYNSLTTQAASVANFAGIFEANIAIYDGLDTTCGNQLAAGPNPVPGRYSFLAGALANDEIFVNSASGTCNQYFGVELDALTPDPADRSGDCGGRTPLYDVIDVTYSALAVGSTGGVGDGVDSDPDPVTHSATAFPFLAPPL